MKYFCTMTLNCILLKSDQTCMVIIQELEIIIDELSTGFDILPRYPKPNCMSLKLSSKISIKIFKLKKTEFITLLS